MEKRHREKVETAQGGCPQALAEAVPNGRTKRSPVAEQACEWSASLRHQTPNSTTIGVMAAKKCTYPLNDEMGTTISIRLVQ
jgi:hypothetical protein